jgi:hypothetical protein
MQKGPGAWLVPRRLAHWPRAGLALDVSRPLLYGLRGGGINKKIETCFAIH